MNSAEEVLELLYSSLKNWNGEEILISKTENHDGDQTVLTLDDVSITERGMTIDGYVSPLALKLRGEGRVVMEDTDVPLPAASYEIPLTGVEDAHFDGNWIYLLTERASYMITKL